MEIQNVIALFLTHSHWDHARCASLFTNAAVHAGPSELKSRFTRGLSSVKHVSDGQTVSIGGTKIQTIATPGHTPGSHAYLVDQRFLFTGDTIRLRHGEIQAFPAYFNYDGNVLRSSIRRLACLKDTELLLTAHSGLLRNPEHAFRQWQPTYSDNTLAERA